MTSKKEQAMRCIRENRWQDAKHLLREISENQPDDPEVWAYLGAINGRLGELAEAVTCCNKAIAIMPTHVAAHMNLGLAQLALGKPKEALVSLRAAIEINPQTPGAVEAFQQADLAAAADTDKLTIGITGNVSICVPRSLQLMTPYILLEQEDWFEDEIVFVRRLMRPGMRVLDIGANFGAYTLTMARLIGDSGKVWAFEPASRTASYLRQSINANGFSQVHLIQAALSGRKGTAQLGLEMNAELNSLTHSPGRTSATETVQVLTLDECAHEFGWHAGQIEFIKLDAEGEEQNILRGGGKFLTSQSPLIMFELKHGKTVNSGLIGHFRELGYVTYRLVPGLQLLSLFDESEPIDPYQLNLFCCKPDRAESLERAGLLARATHPLDPADKSARNDAIASLRPRPQFNDSWSRWEAATAQPHPGWDDYHQALGSYALSRNSTLHPSVRLSWLNSARGHLQKAAAVYSNIPRLMSAARMEWELGQRAAAVERLHKLVNELFEKPPTPLDEPFLAVSLRADELVPGTNELAWCRAITLEQLEQLESYSSYFTGRKVLGRLDLLAGLPFTGAEMERRRQLVRLRHGLQACPQDSPRLTNENCLNLAFWRGA